jgi:hypothetical protein
MRYDPEAELQEDIGPVTTAITICIIVCVGALCRWIDAIRRRLS